MFEYFLEKSPEDAAERETQQLVNIATAANHIPYLEHLILHTLPAGEKLAGRGSFVPHMDVSEYTYSRGAMIKMADITEKGKDRAADVIKETMPSMAQKTTFLWIGFFSTNFHSNPMMKPIEIVCCHSSTNCASHG